VLPAYDKLEDGDVRGRAFFYDSAANRLTFKENNTTVWKI
jgi:hypothetical protein